MINILIKSSFISEFCTFSTTGEVGIEQKLYICVTCKMDDGYCICEICIKNCHQGHTVLFSEYDLEGYCDCGEQGSQGKRSCNMLKGRILLVKKNSKFDLFLQALKNWNITYRVLTIQHYFRSNSRTSRPTSCTRRPTYANTSTQK